jgi:hypothetical protein
LCKNDFKYILHNKGYRPEIEEDNSNIKVNVCDFIDTQTGDFYSKIIKKETKTHP